MLKGHLQERFWAPLGIQIPLASGYLNIPIPSRPNSLLGEDSLATLSQLRDIPCLILLGESGIGKSLSLKDEEQRLIEQREQNPDVDVCRFELGLLSSSTEFENWLTTNSQITHWREGKSHLHLLLDSVDEGQIKVEKIGRILLSHLEKWPLKRLSLRLTCRPLDWPENLQQRLPQLWGKTTGDSSEITGKEDGRLQSKARYYEMAPLRRNDVEFLAREEGIAEVSKFLDAIDAVEATPFASSPLTLEFLTRLYQDRKSLPANRLALFELGCLELAKEPNLDRIAENSAGRLKASERLAIATRLAAATLLGNYSAISKRTEAHEIDKNHVPASSVTDGSEATQLVFQAPVHRDLKPGEIEVDENGVRETLGSALFCSGEGQSLRWRHRSFAEFLTARFLVQRGLSGDSALKVLIVEDRVVPQLTGVAAFLAEHDTAVRKTLIQTEPSLLLQMDSRSLSSDEKAELTATILEELQELRLQWRDLYGRCARWGHKKLPDQLRDFVFDQSLNLDARHAAFTLVEGCDWSNVRDLLLQMLAAEDQPLRLRAEAAELIAERGSATDKHALLPFAKLTIPKSGKDKTANDRYRYTCDLKGYALRANWPMHLTAQELFVLLESPREYGRSAYQNFLSECVVQHLTPKDLPVALQWVGEQTDVAGQPARRANFYIGRLCDEITLFAWENIERHPNVAPALAKLAIERFARHKSLMGSPELCSW